MWLKEPWFGGAGVKCPTDHYLPHGQTASQRHPWRGRGLWVLHFPATQMALWGGPPVKPPEDMSYFCAPRPSSPSQSQEKAESCHACFSN